MIYTLYETTNKINGKIYVGIHKTNFLDDEYLGSGKLISAAIVKYGKENFQKRILQIFNNLEDARNAEAEIVTEEFVKDNSNYNLALGGGLGGKDINGLTFEGRSHTKETKERIGLRLRSKPRKLSDEGRLSISKSSKENELRKRKFQMLLRENLKQKNISEIFQSQEKFNSTERWVF